MKTVWIKFQTLILFLSWLGCSSAPSEQVIKNAISETVQKRVPITWSGSLLGGSNARIESINIIEVGRYNEQKRYWPVRARVRGKCESNLLVRTEIKVFDQVGKFRIYQDDYGHWKAALSGL